jgi:hypothetical protein
VEIHLNILRDGLSRVHESPHERNFQAICKDLQRICSHSQAYRYITQPSLNGTGLGHLGSADFFQCIAFMLQSMGSFSHALPLLPPIHL